MPEQTLSPHAVACLLRRHAREAQNLSARVSDPHFEGNSFDSALVAGRLRQLAAELEALAIDAQQFSP